MIATNNNVEQHLLDNPLPGPLAELTDRVVRRTRLWPSEREEIQAELESHFREGLIELIQQGLTLDQCIAILREQFGDARVAAKLIRRSKIRGRSMRWKIARTAIITALVCMTASAAFAAWIKFGKPTPTVDYGAQLNEPILAIPDEERAWPLMEKLLLQFRIPEEEDAQIIRNLPAPGQDNWAVALEWVKSNRDLLPLIEQATAQPHYGFVYDNQLNWSFLRQLAEARNEPESAFYGDYAPDPLDPELISILLPSLSDLRDVARFLILDARDKLSRAEFEAALTSIELTQRLGVMLFDSRTVIEPLVGAALVNMANDELRRVLYEEPNPLDYVPDELVANSYLLSVAPSVVTADFDAEKIMFEDFVQYLFTDDGNGNGHLIPGQYAKVTVLVDGEQAPARDEGLAEIARLVGLAAMHADRQDTLDKYNELWDEISAYRKLPLYDPQRQEGEAVLQTFKSDPVASRRYAVIDTMLPSLYRADTQLRQTAMALAATQTIVALELYCHAHDSLPDSLDELVPALLQQVPEDIYTGEVLIYEPADDGRFVLYSVGANFEDDGGSTEPGDDDEPLDIVYWPVVD